MVEWLKNKKGGLSFRYFLAIDIGASSGLHIVGWQENGEIKTNEVYRFPNGVQEENGHLTWDVCKLFANVVDGILKAFKQYPQLETVHRCLGCRLCTASAGTSATAATSATC